MAEFSQDIITFEDDTFIIRYTFTDLDEYINNSNLTLSGETFTSNWGFFWCAGLNSDWPTIPTIVRSKATNNWSYATSYIPSDYNIAPVIGTNILNVNFNQNDFNGANALAVDTEYYTELIVDDKANYGNSIVVATGLFYVSPSMFSSAGYRP